VIVALWYRWTRDGHYRWLALCLAILALDLFVGSALLAWEIRLLRDAWTP
jgi:hypothetical protein